MFRYLLLFSTITFVAKCFVSNAPIAPTRSIWEASICVGNSWEWLIIILMCSNDAAFLSQHILSIHIVLIKIYIKASSIFGAFNEVSTQSVHWFKSNYKSRTVEGIHVSYDYDIQRIFLKHYTYNIEVYQYLTTNTRLLKCCLCYFS